MNYDDAIKLAHEIKETLQPFCRKIEIAGSIRRRKAEDIKDVEIVAIPNPAHLHELQALVNKKWGAPLIGAFPSKYTKVRGLANIDFFWCTEQTFGLNFFIRTGPGDFGMRALAHWKKLTGGGYAKDAMLHKADGTVVPTPDEQAVFDALQCRYIEPHKRTERKSNDNKRRKQQAG